MIIVVGYYQEHDETNRFGKVTRPKGYYVDYGINSETGEGICLPSESFESFTRLNCYFSDDLQEWVLK